MAWLDLGQGVLEEFSDAHYRGKYFLEGFDYSILDPNKEKERLALSHQMHLASSRASHKAWKKRNPEKVREQKARWLARKKQAKARLSGKGV